MAPLDSSNLTANGTGGYLKGSGFGAISGVVFAMVIVATLLETEQLGGPATRTESVRVSAAMVGKGMLAGDGGQTASRLQQGGAASGDATKDAGPRRSVTGSDSSSSSSSMSSSRSGVSSSDAAGPVRLHGRGSETAGHTALLLRAHLLTEVQMQRLASYARWCNEARPAVELWVSFDTTAVEGERERVKKALGAEHGLPANAVNFHEYSTEDMLAKFPGLEDVHTRVFKSWRGKSLALGFHNEAIDLWWNDPRVVAKQLRWIWVMELDVGFSGIITTLFANYTDTAADYIMHQSGCHKVDRNWLHRNACSKEYKAQVSNGRMYSYEFVQRYSHAFLNELTTRMGAGAHAWSEEVGCSTHMSSNLTAITLRGKHQGKPFTFKHGRAINNKTFFSKWKDPNLANRLYHPVKGP